MLRAFSTEQGNVTLDPGASATFPAHMPWIDLLSPSREEEVFAERAFDLAIPTREDMVEIEPSSRLYRENGALHLTATVIAGFTEGDPRTVPISFVLTKERLITVRYDDPLSFRAFISHLDRQPELCRSPASTLVFLLDAVVERTADILEEVARMTEEVSTAVFRRGRGPDRKRMSNETLEDILLQIGSAQGVLSKARESLSSLSRMLSFLAFSLPEYEASEAPHLKTVSRDVSSLSDQAAFMSSNVTFLLDAALGLINIEQNAIIKIFSVAAVIFLPPTLVGTVYGMNFEHMPELKWLFGYPMSLGLMVVSAILPYLWFKRKGWL
ncbi:magnesium transporter CorA family protein [Allosphingosinicella deserti]|uniref:Magnesium transport protein CorA n=1 Tax=Allosphingosinicella deserti TaxID=2116704 RepID=A0A2P7QYZ2_9SPHN|nr:magnesium transporter CorA family protein [Sphingomonas deserti]PSJ43169.1 magnesium transporter [Sphingomonas deserti]